MTTTMLPVRGLATASRSSQRFGRFGLEAVMIVMALLFAFPIWIFVTVALKSPSDVAASPLGLPTSLHLDNFVTAWTDGQLGPALVNSIVVTAFSVALVIGCAAPAAYLIARRMSFLSRGLYIAFLLGLMLPMQLGMVPLYQFMRDANLLGTYTSLIIYNVGHQLPFSIFLYAGFLRMLPRDYEDAAMVDGAGQLRAFASVVFPLLRPVTGTVIILISISIWNDLLVPLLYVGGSAQQTLPVAIMSFKGEFSTQWGIIFAGLAIAVAPILIVYFALQRHIIQGFASGLRG